MRPFTTTSLSVALVLITITRPIPALPIDEELAESTLNQTSNFSTALAMKRPTPDCHGTITCFNPDFSLKGWIKVFEDLNLDNCKEMWFPGNEPIACNHNSLCIFAKHGQIFANQIVPALKRLEEHGCTRCGSTPINEWHIDPTASQGWLSVGYNDPVRKLCQYWDGKPRFQPVNKKLLDKEGICFRAWKQRNDEYTDTPGNSLAIPGCSIPLQRSPAKPLRGWSVPSGEHIK